MNLIEDLPQWIAAVGGVGFAGLILGSLLKAWTRVDSRNDLLVVNLTKRLEHAEERVEKAELRVDQLEAFQETWEERRRTNLTVISLLYRAVHRVDPDAPELPRVKAMLRHAYGIDPDTPDEMMAMLNEIDVKPARKAKRG